MAVTRVESVDQFNEIIQNNPNVLMEFFATWCPHCQAFQPVLEAASTQLESEGVFVAQTEIDQFSNLANDFNVESIPTIIFFKNGQEVLRSTGERDEQAVFAFVNQGLQA